MSLPGMTAINRISTRNLLRVGEIVTWLGPTLVVPAMRYAQDPPETRDRLFVRDFSTYAIGSAAYFAMRGLTVRLLQGRFANPNVATMLSMVAGVLGNIAYAGLGAVRFSKWAESKLQARKAATQLPAFSGSVPVTKPAFTPTFSAPVAITGAPVMPAFTPVSVPATSAPMLSGNGLARTTPAFYAHA